MITCQPSMQGNPVRVHIKAFILVKMYQSIECLCRLPKPSGAKLWDSVTQQGLQAVWLSVDHSQCCTSLLLNSGNGERAKKCLAKYGLNPSVCIPCQQVGSVPITESLWLKPWLSCASLSVSIVLQEGWASTGSLSWYSRQLGSRNYIIVLIKKVRWQA